MSTRYMIEALGKDQSILDISERFLELINDLVPDPNQSDYQTITKALEPFDDYNISNVVTPGFEKMLPGIRTYTSTEIRLALETAAGLIEESRREGESFEGEIGITREEAKGVIEYALQDLDHLPGDSRFAPYKYQ